MATPKVGLGLLTFRTIDFLHFRYAQRIVNYSVLFQTVPRINLIKFFIHKSTFSVLSSLFLS